MSSPQLLGPLMIDVEGTGLTADDRELLTHPLVGGLILFARNYENPEQLRALVSEIRTLRDPALLIAVDHEGGRVQRFRSGFTRLPPAGAIGRLYAEDPDRARRLAHAMGQTCGRELRQAEIDLAFAPVVDVDSGVSEIIGDRAWHRRPEVVAELAGQYMRGLGTCGLQATAKHFPGHGAVREDSHIALPVDDRGLGQIRQFDLRPYERLIEQGLPSVMMAHVVYPNVDRLPASFSPRWIHDELRSRLGFGGVVFCDDLSMEGAVSVGGIVERCEAALEAGCDMLPVCNERSSVEQVLDHWRPTVSAERSRRLQTLCADTRVTPSAPEDSQYAELCALVTGDDRA